MTGRSDAETERITSGDTQPTREYLWPAADPEPPRAQRAAVAPAAATVPIAPEAPPAPAGRSGRNAVPAFGAVRPEEAAPPRRKGNRVAGLLITVLAALVFAALDLAVLSAVQVLRDGGSLPDAAASVVTDPVLLAPTIGFVLALGLIVLLVNRASWWAYVLGGFLVAVVAYLAALGALWIGDHGLARPATEQELVQFLRASALIPETLAPAVIAREVTVWAGAWIGARGRRVARRNAERAAAS